MRSTSPIRRTDNAQAVREIRHSPRRNPSPGRIFCADEHALMRISFYRAPDSRTGALLSVQMYAAGKRVRAPRGGAGVERSSRFCGCTPYRLLLLALAAGVGVWVLAVASLLTGGGPAAASEAAAAAYRASAAGPAHARGSPAPVVKASPRECDTRGFGVLCFHGSNLCRNIR